MRDPSAYRSQRRFRARLTPGQTHRLTQIPIHFGNQTKTLGEWSDLLGRKPQHVWSDLKRGVPVGEVLAPIKNSGRDWKRLRAKLKRMGL